MSVDHLQINVIDAIYNNQEWLFQVLPGTHNDAIEALNDFSGAVNAVVGLTKMGTRISSSDTSSTENMQLEVQNPVYSGSSYLSSLDATTLRSSIITQLAAISSYLEGYKDIAVRSYRNDLQKSDGYAYQVSEIDGLEIFVSGCLYNGNAYVEPSDINTFLSDVNNALDTINGLEFAGIVISTYKATTNGIFIGVDDALYNGEKYLSLANAIALRNAIISAIEMVANVTTTNMEVEVRIAKKDNMPST
jgi:hypothetical protein